MTTGPAAAQTTEPVYVMSAAPASEPGARSAAMGGAFVAVADDATAMSTNPAGMSALVRFEFSAGLRVAAFQSVALPSAAGVVSRANYVSPSWFSAVAPLGGRRLALGAYAASNGEANLSFDPVTGPTPGPWQRSISAVHDRSLGMAGSLVLTPNIAVGGSIGIRTEDIATNSRVLNGSSVGGEAEICDFVLIDSGNGPEWSAGALLRPFDAWSVGIVYRSRTTATLRGEGTNCGSVSTRDVDFVQPSEIRFGFAGRLSPVIRVAFDVRRQLTSESVTGRFLALEYSAGPTPLRAEDFSMNDNTSFHAGGEYVLIGSGVPLALRGGVFRRSSDVILSGPSSLIVATVGVPRDVGRTGYSFGVGIVADRHLEVNMAAVKTSRQFEFTWTFVVRP